ncbi:MAG: ABC transporter ATP-binding protein [Alphaproteobacteria bacterium]
MSRVAFAGISKSFDSFAALHPTDLEVAEGEFLTLLGPSGSGKTTLLNICAGYLAPTRGRLLVDGRDVTALPPRRRNMGMVFQSYALFPHMDVRENVAYGLRVRRVAEADIARRVTEALRVVRLEGLERRAVKALSGGQQQRVALARALVIEPDVLLMDEPLGALDRQLRKEVQLEIRRMHLARPRTTLYVTHDQEEALVMSDRVAVMRAGRVVQAGTGRALYDRPADAFVARFLGESNLVAGTVSAAAGGTATLAVPGLPPIVGAATGVAAGDPAVALIRPENLRPEPGGLAARIVERVHLGEIVAIRLVLGNGLELWCRRLAGTDPTGDAIEIGWDPAAVSILPDAA